MEYPQPLLARLMQSPDRLVDRAVLVLRQEIGMALPLAARYSRGLAFTAPGILTPVDKSL